MNVQTALEEYLLACAADGLRLASIKWYRSLLSDFVEYFQGQDLITITPTLIRQYIVVLQSRSVRYVNAAQKPEQRGGLSDASIAGHIRALHSFWGWCSREYDLQNPMMNIRRGRRVSLEPKAISPADFIKLFNATGLDNEGVRNRAVLVFLADTGCRLGGLLSVTLDRLDLNARRAIVQEKGQQIRTVLFTHYTARILSLWLNVRQSHTDYVFCSMRTGECLSVSGVNQLLRRLKYRAGVTGRVNPHSFRHNFAREYLKNGGDLVTLARLLGHTNIATTAAYYAVFDVDELAELHDRFSPLRGLELTGEMI